MLRKQDEVHLKSLNHEFEPIARLFLNKIQEGKEAFPQLLITTCPKWSVRLTQSKRDIYYQAGLYARGRKFDEIRRVWNITDKSLVVTDTLLSKHVLGLAIDIAPFTDGGTPFWPNPEDRDPKKAQEAREFWLAMATIGEECGLVAGARWEKPDYPHYQLGKE